MPSATPAQTVQLRILVIDPPAGVVFAVQRGKADLLPPTAKGKGPLQFDLALRLGAPQADGSPNYLGDFAQGTLADRFVYLNSGTAAGQHSVWSRRAKIKLGGIPAEMAQAAMADPALALEARVQGTMRDGGPICASVKPEAITWGLVKSAA